jgi:hypothetical protein
MGEACDYLGVAPASTQAMVDRARGNTLAFRKFSYRVLVAVGIIEQSRGASIVALCERPPTELYPVRTLGQSCVSG